MDVGESNSLKKAESKKFISMMNSLTWYIRQDVKNQQKIFECLNSTQQKKLFESMREDEQDLRITAVIFILYLLHNNNKLLGLILKRDGLDMNPSAKTYIIGGLKSYQLNRQQMIEIMKIITSLQEKDNALCWSINIKTKKVQYLYFQQIKTQKLPNLALYNQKIIDPKQNIIGIFTHTEQSMPKSKITIKNLTPQSASKVNHQQKHNTSRY